MNVSEVKIKEQKVLLNQGEELCEECQGKKYIEVFVSRNQKAKFPCGKCGGSGKIDWIQKATGVHESEEFEYNDSSSSISISSSYGYSSSSENISKYQICKSTIVEDNSCHVLQELRNMVKSIWVQTGYRLLKTIKSEIEKILKFFKMALTS